MKGIREGIRKMASLRCGGFMSYSIPREKCNLSQTSHELSNLNDHGETPAEEISSAAIEELFICEFNCEVIR